MILKNKTINLNIDNESVTITISPCSWMYANYGLQIEAKLESTGETIYLNSEVEWEDLTDRDMDQLVEQLYIAEPCNCGNARLRANGCKTNRGELCEICFVDKIMQEFKEEQEKERLQDKQNDEEMQSKGYTYKLIAWIHPSRGDDYNIVVYYKLKPTQRQIQERLKESMVKNDFVVKKI